MRDFVQKFIAHKLNTYFPDWAIIKARQNVAHQFENYMVFTLMGERSIGDQLITNGSTYTYGGIREAMLNIQAFGEGALDVLSDLWLLFERDVDDCFENNIAILSGGEVRDTTSLLDNRHYQERASVDFTISYPREVDYKVSTIESIEGTPMGYFGNKNIYTIGDDTILSTEDYNTVAKIYDKFVGSEEFNDAMTDYKGFIDIEVKSRPKNKSSIIANVRVDSTEDTIEEIEISIDLEN